MPSTNNISGPTATEGQTRRPHYILGFILGLTDDAVMAYQTNAAWEYYPQNEEAPGIGPHELRPILCSKCHGSYHHIRNGTICSRCNNSFIELIPDADYRRLSEKKHSSSGGLSSGHSDTTKKHDSKGGTSRTSRGTRH